MLTIQKIVMPHTIILSGRGESATRMVAIPPNKRSVLKNALIEYMPQRVGAVTVVVKRAQ